MSVRILPDRHRGRAHGFTLVELLVAMTLGLFVIGGVAAAYVHNQRTRAELERDSRQTENGRYAVQLLSDDVRHAGFYGEFDPRTMNTPTVLPPLCEASLADLRPALQLSLQGADDAAALGCLPDLKAGTDVVVVRRAATCTAGTAGCEAVVAGEPYFQASLCSDPAQSELASLSALDHFALSSSGADLDRTARDCAAPAPLRRFVVRIYYVATDNAAGDGIPTLKRARLGAAGFAIEPLVEGIEQLQVEYGMDSDGDGAPDEYGTDAGVLGGCADVTCRIANWRNVTAVRLHLLARNIEPSAGFDDGKTYVLGTDAAGAEKILGPFHDGFRRHVYSTAVRLNNVAGRRE